MDKLVCVDDFKKEALQILPENPRNYFTSGADDEITTEENSKAFSRWLIRPRVLRDVSKRDLSTMVFGKKVQVPFGVSPCALQRLAHAEGECGSAKAVEAIGGIFILSLYATTSYEEIAEVVPNVRRWFQFFIYKDRKVTESIIRRAENAGFEAMVLTVDAQYVGNRRSSKRDPLQLPDHIKLPNGTYNVENEKINIFKLHDMLADGVTWEVVSWLKTISKLPLVLKGIQTPEDAVKAVKYGADAVFLSNHGGRQIDTAVPTIDMLSEIVRAVGSTCAIFVDGGVRKGTDIFKALSLGANMVFVGRPIIYGLACGGAKGATKVLQILKEELDLTMALSGVAKIGDINKTYVQHYSEIPKL